MWEEESWGNSKLMVAGNLSAEVQFSRSPQIRGTGGHGSLFTRKRDIRPSKPDSTPGNHQDANDSHHIIVGKSFASLGWWSTVL